MLDELTLIGNIGNVTPLNHTQTGTPYLNFSVAVNRRWKDRDGNTHEQTIWYRCTVWARHAEVLTNMLTKGRQVFVKGQLYHDDYGNPRIWTDNNGNIRTSFELRVETLKLLGPKPEISF